MILSMSPVFGILLAVTIVAMIAAVVLLSRLDGRNRRAEASRQASVLGLTASSESDSLAYLDWLWRRTDSRRKAWGLLEGHRNGWDTRAFLFAPAPDNVTMGGRLLTRVFAHNWAPVAGIALDNRTADQRAVLIAVARDGEPAPFKIRGRRCIARNQRARELLGGRPHVTLRTWSPPARVTLRTDWLFLQSFYVVPKWIGRYVEASTEICETLLNAGVIERRSGSSLPTGPAF